MKTKFPAEIENFAEFYFRAEDRATLYGTTKRFRKVDQKEIALRFKTLMDSPVIESVDQLCRDLAEYREGITYMGHYYRLSNFAKRCNIKVATRQGRHGMSRSMPRLHGQFDFKATMLDGINRALSSGIPFTTVREQSQQLLEETHGRIRTTTVSNSLQQLIKETGITPRQLAEIAASM